MLYHSSGMEAVSRPAKMQSHQSSHDSSVSLSFVMMPMNFLRSPPAKKPSPGENFVSFLSSTPFYMTT
jgi:hypothetical protein